MMKPMRKNMWREIGANKGRFIAIVLIILLGTLTFVGVRAAGPGLEDSMDTLSKPRTWPTCSSCRPLGSPSRT